MTHFDQKHYAAMFADILADVDGEDPEATKKLMDGFMLALEDWFNYHDVQARTYSDLRVRIRKSLGVS